MTKKILEDPLVNIKKRQIECTAKILQNPMRLKKQQVVKPEKYNIEDHQLDMILVSRLKSYQKAGLDLAKILSITKKEKSHKSKPKLNNSSSEDLKSDIHKKTNYKQKNLAQKSNHFERGDRKQNHKNSLEYKDYRRNKNRNEHKSISPSDDVDFYKRNDFTNNYKYSKYDNQTNKDNHTKQIEKSIGTEKNDNNNYINKKNEGYRSISKDKNNRNSKNKYRNNPHTNEQESNNKKSNDNNVIKDRKSKYRQQEDKNRKTNYIENDKRYKSDSLDKEPNWKKQNNTSEHSKYKYKMNLQHNKLNSSDREQELNCMDSRNRYEYHKIVNNRRSRSKSLTKDKKYQKINYIKKDKYNHKSSSSSISDDEKANNVMKKSRKRQYSPDLQSDNEKDHHKNKQDYGLFVS